MTKIGVVTVGRSDFGLYRPLLRALSQDRNFDVQLIVGGMHLSEAFGNTLREIEAEGFSPAALVDMEIGETDALRTALSMGLGTQRFAEAYVSLEPDIVIVLGDRYEMHSAAVATVPFNLPLIHIAGGNVTEGAFDDAFRHSITKLAHVHFTDTEECARRVRQMGEPADRVFATGALGLDNLHHIDLPSKDDLFARYDLRTDWPTLLVTMHPTTRTPHKAEAHIAALLSALEKLKIQAMITAPNADPGGAIMLDAIKAFVSTHDRARYVDNLGTRNYFAFLKYASAMVGNSSSGLVEAASFRLPVVDIGIRQAGRLAPANVIHCEHDTDATIAAIERALSPDFAASLKGLVNPYGDGHAAEQMIEILSTLPPRDILIKKKFVDL